MSEPQVRQMLEQVRELAAAEGLPFDFERGQVRVSTRKAHRLMWLAALEGGYSGPVIKPGEAAEFATMTPHSVYARSMPTGLSLP